jgi:hypothetical protein
MPHFACDHGEATPLIASARGLDGSVQRGDIGLKRAVESVNAIMADISLA